MFIWYISRIHVSLSHIVYNYYIWLTCQTNPKYFVHGGAQPPSFSGQSHRRHRITVVNLHPQFNPLSLLLLFNNQQSSTSVILARRKFTPSPPYRNWKKRAVGVSRVSWCRKRNLRRSSLEASRRASYCYRRSCSAWARFSRSSLGTGRLSGEIYSFIEIYINVIENRKSCYFIYAMYVWRCWIMILCNYMDIDRLFNRVEK